MPKNLLKTMSLIKESLINLTTGPVTVHAEVTQIFGEKAISHRANEFVSAFQSLQTKLSNATNAKYVSFLTGSGTLANECMISQIKRINKLGLVLANGEFGFRLINQCKRQKIPFLSLEKDWGDEFILDEIEEVISANNTISWILFTVCESSTGCIVDFEGLCKLGQKNNLKIYADATSAIGNLYLDFSNVTLATCSSGKGIGSYAGLAIVFSNQVVLPDNSIPVYLDLGYYMANNGIPFTISSNLILALNRAVDYTLSEEHIKTIGYLSNRLLDGLGKISDIEILNSSYKVLSHIITIIPQHGISSEELGNAIWQKGVETSFNSGYLKSRNYLQIAIMGIHKEEEIEQLLNALSTELLRLKANKLSAAM